MKDQQHHAIGRQCVLFLLLSRCDCTPAHAFHNETLTKNITHLLDNLLTNYDKKIRPMNKDDPTQPLLVTVDISIRSMGPISEKDMEFSMDCYFRQYWMDERLKFYGSMDRLSLASKVLYDIWKPDTYIKNGRQSYLHKLTIPNILLRVEQNGRVYVSQRLTIRARCPMYMRKFPMDSQACILRLGSLGYSRKDIQFRWSSVTLEPELGAELAQYTLLKYITVENNETDPRGPSFDHLSVLEAYFLLKRQQGYFILQIYIPCSLIVLMSWVSFWINKEASPARVSLGIMTVLNMATLGMGLRSDLPKVSYSTALDVYVVACFGFVFLALVEYAVINFAAIVQLRKAVHRMHVFAGAMMGANAEEMTRGELAQINDADNADEDMRIEEAHRAAGVAMGHVQPPVAQGMVERRRLFDRVLCRRKKTVMVRLSGCGKGAVQKQRSRLAAVVDPQAVDQIDAVSKVLFPLMYTVFNMFYWTLYLYYIDDEIDSLYLDDMKGEDIKVFEDF